MVDGPQVTTGAQALAIKKTTTAPVEQLAPGATTVVQSEAKPSVVASTSAPYRPPQVNSYIDFMKLSGSKISVVDDAHLLVQFEKDGIEDIDLEKGLTKEQAQTIANKYGFEITSAAFDAIDRQGVHGESDGRLTISDLKTWMGKAIGYLAVGTGNTDSAIKTYLTSNQFKIINADDIIKTVEDKYLPGGATSLKVQDILSHTNSALDPLVKAVLLKILGYEAVPTEELSRESLAKLFVTMSFLGQIDSPESVFSTAKGISKYEGEGATAFLAWFTKGTTGAVEEKKAEGKEGVKESGDDFQSLIAKAEDTESVNEAVKLYEQALEKAQPSQKTYVRRQLVAKLSSSLDPKELLDGLNEKEDGQIKQLIVDVEARLKKLEAIAATASQDLKKSITEFLGPAKWNDKDAKARNIRGYLEKLKDTAGLSSLKLDVKVDKVKKDNEEILQLLASPDTRAKALEETESEKRKEYSDKLLKFAEELAAALDGVDPKLRQSNEELVNFAYTMAGMFDVSKYDKGIEYYAKRIGVKVSPSSDDDAQLLEYKTRMLYQRAVTLNGLGGKNKTTAAKSLKGEVKKGFVEIKKYHETAKKSAEERKKKETETPKQQAIQVELDKYAKKAKDIGDIIKGLSGRTIKDLPEYRNIKDALERPAGSKRNGAASGSGSKKGSQTPSW